jgi:DNA polymerase III subunit epsilon
MGQAVPEVQHHCVVIDFETTGMSPAQGARATEIAAVRIENGRITGHYQSLMYTGAYIPPFIEQLTGISQEMLREAPPAGEVMREAFEFIGDLPLVAHNASFDRGFLAAELARIHLRVQQPFVCSLKMARRIYPAAPNHRLGTLVEYAQVPRQGDFHRALADARMTAHLWLKMRDEIQARTALAAVSFELMQQLENMSRRAVEVHLERLRAQHLRA